MVENKKCYINDIKPDEKAKNGIDFILGGIFTHCLPIYIILRIYNVQKLDLGLSESLIAVEPNKEESSVNTSQ